VALLLGIDADWINAGPTRQLESGGLPDGFGGRLHTRTYGGLTLRLAGRFDQICFKLYAAVDQGRRSKHLVDLRALGATDSELESAAAWVRTQDTSEHFPDLVEQVLAVLRGHSDG
jgi:hypothetical protein